MYEQRITKVRKTKAKLAMEYIRLIRFWNQRRKSSVCREIKRIQENINKLYGSVKVTIVLTKHHTKSNLEVKGLFLSHFLITDPHQKQWGQELVQGRDFEAGADADTLRILLTSLFSMVFSTCSVIEPRPLCSMVAPFTMVWALTHQSLIEIIYGLA